MRNIHDEFSHMVNNLVKPGEDIIKELTPEKANLLHMAILVAGEAGELLDVIKKAVIYNKPYDMENIIEELGDIEFGLEGVRQVFNLNRKEILSNNLDKLLRGKNARYAKGKFTNKQAQDRADKQ